MALHSLYRPPIPHLLRQSASIYKPITEKEIETQREIIVRLRNVRIEQARRDPNAFIEYCFDDDTGSPFVQAWFHDDWQKWISDKNRALIIAPRAHGKTSQIVGRIIWELGRNPNLRIKIVCASDSKAVERLYEIIQHINSNQRVRDVFPNLIQADIGDWTKHKIVVRRTAKHRDASIEALGITSTATGGRADLIIADDVVDRRNALNFPALRKLVRDAWFSDWVQLLVPGGRVVYICTLWHKDDLSHHLMTSKEYSVLRYDVGDSMESVWPEVWSSEILAARKREIGSVEFNRSFRNIASSEDDAIINSKWLQYVDFAPAGGVEIVLSYDLAISKSSSADYFACTVFAIDKANKRIFVVDSYHAKLDVPSQERRVVSDWKQWRADVVLVESVSGFGYLEQILKNDFPAINVKRVIPKGDKVTRLNSVAHLIENGTVAFVRKDEKVKNDFERGDLVSELIDFPFARHDDMVDSFSQGLTYYIQSIQDENKVSFFVV